MKEYKKPAVRFVELSAGAFCLDITSNPSPTLENVFTTIKREDLDE